MAVAAGQEAWQSCAKAPVTGSGGLAGSLQVSWTALSFPATADAVNVAGAGGPLMQLHVKGFRLQELADDGRDRLVRELVIATVVVHRGSCDVSQAQLAVAEGTA